MITVLRGAMVRSSLSRRRALSCMSSAKRASALGPSVSGDGVVSALEPSMRLSCHKRPAIDSALAMSSLNTESSGTMKPSHARQRYDLRNLGTGRGKEEGSSSGVPGGSQTRQRSRSGETLTACMS